jgi:uncharacterized membrane protein
MMSKLFNDKETFMKRSSLIIGLTAAISVAVASTAVAMEKCVVTKNGKNMVRAHKADCQTGKTSCSGQNTADNHEAWIFVPQGQCAKINAGDCSGLEAEDKAKLEPGVCQ